MLFHRYDVYSNENWITLCHLCHVFQRKTSIEIAPVPSFCWILLQVQFFSPVLITFQANSLIFYVQPYFSKPLSISTYLWINYLIPGICAEISAEKTSFKLLNIFNWLIHWSKWRMFVKCLAISMSFHPQHAKLSTFLSFYSSYTLLSTLSPISHIQENSLYTHTHTEC